MSAPINLNRARKAREKVKKRAQVEENAVKFGRTRAARERDRAAADKAARDLDGKQRE